MLQTYIYYQHSDRDKKQRDLKMFVYLICNTRRMKKNQLRLFQLLKKRYLKPINKIKP